MPRKIQEYRGRKVIVRFDAGKCIHSRNCVTGHPGVFATHVEGPWIRPNEGSVEQIMHIALTCPSGAITCERLDGGTPEAAPRVNTVHVRENGPLAVHADIHIEDSQVTRATLCRCGASRNKPYCDGSHTEAGFNATGEPAAKKLQPLEASDGPLAITAIENGPLRLRGALEICCGSGRLIERTAEAWLCRCGQSNNKPFCDGSHKKSGFQAEGESPRIK